MSDGLLNPFGTPEGARADIDELTRGFVAFGSPLRWKGLASEPSDYTARILVGQKGSGKTVYLRRAHGYASNDKNVVATGIDEGSPSTADVKRFAQVFSKYDLREHWCALWKRAILRSATSHLINNKHLAAHVTDPCRKHLVDDFQHLLRPVQPYRDPVAISNEVGDILRHGTYNAFHNYLYDPAWGQFETALGDALRQAPPLCLYLDGIDDNFQHAPMYWLECQIGLFDAVMGLLRDPRFGSRLHVFATIRDLVLVKILQGEHALRNYEEPHVRVLAWNAPALDYLVGEKLATLDPIFFQRPGGKDAHSWLGASTFYNTSRKVTEPITQYLFRHTRLLPRDIITLGNLLCQELYRLRWYPDGFTREEAIARAVRFAARRLGAEQLTICAHQIATDQEPAGADRHERAYTGTDEYVRNLTDTLKDFVRSFGRDRFSHSLLLRQEDAAKHTFGERTDVLSTLWLNGLLGFVDPKREPTCVQFYSTDLTADFKMPRNKRSYAFHSALIDAVGIKATGKPVVQCL